MDTQKAQIVERLKQANNILVTVSANPTVDQLSAAIGTTLLLNKLGKHATAVFSGAVPSVLEFLEPAKTLETNTDSLRDFIISLDKSKADKLRYKVEDNHVRIFITPYRTSISDKDLVFSQGDFNVEVVVALGVAKQEDLDKAISVHGRILHDATVVAISDAQVTGLGTMNLINPKASSLCEILVDIGTALKPDVLDTQMATAFLTGIVAQTNRFSNEKTTSQTMEVSSKLLAAGANQQLVATKLQPPKPATPPPPPVAPKPAAALAQDTAAPAASLPEPVAEQVAPDGSLQIDHGPAVDLDTYELSSEDPDSKVEQIHIDDQGMLKAVQAGSEETSLSPNKKVIQPLAAQPVTGTPTDELSKIAPPTMGGTLTASGTDNETEQAVNPMSEMPVANRMPLLSHDTGVQQPPEPGLAQPPASPQLEPIIPAPQEQVVQATNTLADLERSVNSPHITSEPIAESPVASAPQVPGVDINSARDAVQQAMAVPNDEPLPPIEALGAQYVDLPGVGGSQADQNQSEQPSAITVESLQPTVTDQSAPPPVPPPMMPPSFTPSA